MAGKPAARLGDPTAHGGAITGPGIPTVMIGKMPAATMGDMHVCPMVTPGTPPIPHVGGPITLGSTGVLIGKKPAARMGDMAVCVGPPSSVIMGCPTVMIGEAGSGSQAGSAGSAAAAASASVKSPKTLSPIEPPPRREAEVLDISDIVVIVKDSSGKPFAGADFLLEDPDGVRHLVATGSDGSFRRTGPWKAGKGFKANFRSLSEAKFGKTELADGEETPLQAKADGFAAGADASFRLTVQSLSGRTDLASIPANVQGDKLEGRWTYRQEQMIEILGRENVPLDTDIEIGLTVVCGFEACVAPTPCVVKVAPPEPVEVRKIRSA
ncbi:MAG: PAAR domain-containing protein [Fibrobacteria bacterium]|nr:PAAR domain-containing protein [Fibrobacteria bacterium]